MKKKIALVLYVLAGFAPLAFADLMNEYRAQIDYSCSVDADCVIKDVGNCCGYYPECVNINANVSGETVRQACREGGLLGVCGYPSIQSCKCTDNKCTVINGPSLDEQSGEE